MSTKGYLILLGGMREIERILKERMHEDEETIRENGVPLLLESMADQIDELKAQLAASPPGDGGLRELARKAAEGGQAAADELMTEFISKKRAANWGIINDGLLACDALLRAIGRPAQTQGEE